MSDFENANIDLNALEPLQINSLHFESHRTELIRAKENAERYAKQYTDLYEEIYDFSPAGYFTVCAKGVINTVNLSASNLIGIKRGALIGLDLKRFLTYDSHATFSTFLSKIFETKEKHICEVEFINSEKGNRHIHFEGIVSRQNDKCLLSAIDVTERKALEISLVSTRDHLSSVLNAIPDLLFELDADGCFYSFHSPRTDLLAADPKVFIGKTIKEILPADVANVCLASIKEAAMNGYSIGRQYELEIGQEKKWFELSVTRNFVFGEANQRFIVLSRDITDRKQTEKNLKEYSQILKKTNAIKDKFFAIIAHDLRNPFTGIINLLDLIIKSNTVKGSGSEVDNLNYLQLIRNSAKATQNLLENLIQWAQSQTGALDFEPSYISLKNTIEETLPLLMANIVRKKIKLEVDLREDIVFADASFLETIFRNLITNSINFTHANGTITISSILNKNFAEVSISDTGIGIEVKDIQNLFHIDSKFTKIGTENEKGSGLGLILCKEFVEKQGGRIWVESEFGKGSTFTFSLPLAN